MMTRRALLVGTIAALFVIGLSLLNDRSGGEVDARHPDRHDGAAPALASAVIPFDREHFAGQVLVPRHEARIGLDLNEAEEIAGLFLMGNVASRENLALSVPAHSEIVGPFLLDDFEVTRAAFQRFVENTPDLPRRARFSGWADDDETPANNISAHEADRFSNWCGRRLPTAVEWEAAARKNDSRERRYWPWGDTHDPREDENKDGLRIGDLQEIPLSKAGENLARNSALGLMEMAGNVAEWTASPLEPYEGIESVDLSLLGVRRAWRGLYRRGRRELRGGHNLQRAVARMTTWRLSLDAAARSPYIGFRTALSHEGPMRQRFERARGARLVLATLMGDGRELVSPEAPLWRQTGMVVARDRPTTSPFSRAEVMGCAPLPRNACGTEFLASEPVRIAIAIFDLTLRNPELPPGIYLAMQLGDRLEFRTLDGHDRRTVFRGAIIEGEAPGPWHFAGHDGQGGLVLDVRRSEAEGSIRFVLPVGKDEVSRCRWPEMMPE